MRVDLETLHARLRERVPAAGAMTDAFGETSVEVPREALIEAASFLRQEGPFEVLADWSCVDLLGVEPPERRFLCAAQLASVRHPARLRLRVYLPEDEVACPSLTGLWPGADFLEREMFDFFGISFAGHPDLRRIFMPDGWDGFPQRKDHPLGGVDIDYAHGAVVHAPDARRQGTTTTGYPGRIS